MKKVENLKEIKTLYKIICDREGAGDDRDVLHRVNTLQYLERITHQNFVNKKDFHDKMNRFISEQESLRVES